MEVIVVEEHTSEYPNPIYLKQGDEVQLGEMDDEFPNWIFITTDSGVQGVALSSVEVWWVPLNPGTLT
ncbi:SH3 domain-containing protein [Vibrio cholerae]|uniref:SH3 domain-containing protein n=1 Tax=Vibrio cholerae TaxID=666 RepID=UPI003A0FDC66